MKQQQQQQHLQKPMKQQQHLQKPMKQQQQQHLQKPMEQQKRIMILFCFQLCSFFHGHTTKNNHDFNCNY